MKNFYQMNCLMNGEEPYELKPLNTNDLKRYAVDPDFEEELMQQSGEIQDMDLGDNIQTIDQAGEVQKIDKQNLNISLRPEYEMNDDGTYREV